MLPTHGCGAFRNMIETCPFLTILSVHNICFRLYCGFSGGSVVKNPLQYRQYGRCEFDPWVGRIPLEKEMATHSSILACKILCREEPGRLQSLGSQRVGHDWAHTNTTARYTTQRENFLWDCSMVNVSSLAAEVWRLLGPAYIMR